jgi:C4-dicarboxylate-specific signal transduction histidine kinase
VAWVAARWRVGRAQLRERLAQGEAEVQQHRNEVAQLTRLATLGELSAALAHELNQPLAAILSNAQAARRFLASGDADPVEIGEILEDIVADDRRASDVINRVRAILKKGSFEPQKLDVNELLRDVLRLMGGDLNSHAVDVTLELAADLPTIRGDRVQLQQVLINLLLNAEDAMAETPADARQITLRSKLASADRFVEISVKDSGCGIPDGDGGAKIFDPYHTTKADGLGLGLSLSRSIALAHGGELWVANNAGAGATFKLTLPEWQD